MSVGVVGDVQAVNSEQSERREIAGVVLGTDRYKERLTRDPDVSIGVNIASTSRAVSVAMGAGHGSQSRDINDAPLPHVHFLLRFVCRICACVRTSTDGNISPITGRR